MNKNRLIDQLAGQWIVQSTNYSLTKNLKYQDLLLNQVQWEHIDGYKVYRNQLKKYFSNNTVDTYRIKSKKNNGVDVISYIVLVHQGSKLNSIIKLDHDFALLNQFMVQNQSEHHLTIMSLKGNISIVEKIYFLNCNLKVIKSTIQRFNKCIGASFSSEIRIS